MSNKTIALHYRIVTDYSEDDNRFISCVPAFPHILTFGDTAGESATEAEKVIKEFIAILEADKLSLPEEPDQVIQQFKEILLFVNLSKVSKVCRVPRTTLQSKIIRGSSFTKEQGLKIKIILQYSHAQKSPSIFPRGFSVRGCLSPKII